MPKVNEYRALSARKCDHINNTANEMIKDGWQPQGSMTVAESLVQVDGGKTIKDTTFVQVMVKYEED